MAVAVDIRQVKLFYSFSVYSADIFWIILCDILQPFVNDDLFDDEFGDSDDEQNGDLVEDNSPKSPAIDCVEKPVESNSDREPQDSGFDEETSIKAVDERQKQEALAEKVRK